jgi:arsenate reductase
MEHTNMTENSKIRVLFVCTHNQARSQMAEGLLKKLGKGRFEAFSAGSEPASQVHPMAVKSMAEVGIDISHQKTKGFEEFLDQEFDYIITTCDRSNETCPTFPGEPHRIHWGLPDPTIPAETAKEQQQNFDHVAMTLQGRIRLLIDLPRPARLKV